MRLVLVVTFLAAILLAGCTDTMTDGQVDAGADSTTDVMGDAVADTVADIRDSAAVDVTADLYKDATDEAITDIISDIDTDALADLPSDTTDDALADLPGDTYIDPCQPVTCDLFCQHGYRIDAAGCVECSCRECIDDKDCAGLIPTCDQAVCGDGGMCLCDCTGKTAQYYQCPDGTYVPWCACGPLGYDCVTRPEERCPTLCTPGTNEQYPCQDGSSVPWCECTRNDCVPECRNAGTADEGWYNPCTDAVIVLRPCQGCRVSCMAIGTRSEGWTDDCGSGRIEWAFCGPHRTCDDTAPTACATSACTILDTPATFTCPDKTTVPECSCAVPDGLCPPECRNVGSFSEGWYDGCSGTLVRYASCGNCTVSCGGIGTRDEGWHSSCDGAISSAPCGSGTWACSAAPWAGCTGHAQSCVGEGDPTMLSNPSKCCPGLAMIDVATWDGTQCIFLDCACAMCTYCGDGRCVPPENRCNCPADCLPGTPPLPSGGLCSADSDCAKGLVCAGTWSSPGPGVCTILCNPMAMGPRAQCETGYACVPVPDAQAPGFCLDDCNQDLVCPYPLTCGAAYGDTFAKTCYAWGAFTRP